MWYTRYHLIRIIIGSCVFTKAPPADCLRFQSIHPRSISNIYIIIFLQTEHLLGEHF